MPLGFGTTPKANVFQTPYKTEWSNVGLSTKAWRYKRRCLGHWRQILFVGDFNAGTNCVMLHPNSRGNLILEMAVGTALVLNIRSSPTFWYSGYGGNNLDLTFGSVLLASSADGWRLLKELSATNHQSIAFEVSNAIFRCPKPWQSRWVWNVAMVNMRQAKASWRCRKFSYESDNLRGFHAPKACQPLQAFYIFLDACTTMTEHRSAKRELRSIIKNNKGHYWQVRVDEVEGDL